MKKQLVIIGILALLVSVALSGCNQISNTVDTERNKFIGTWQKEDSQYIRLFLFSDGTGSLISMSLTWQLKDGKFLVQMDSASVPCGYYFSNGNTRLHLDTLDMVLGGNWTKE